jgi:hypothetical protein
MTRGKGRFKWETGSGQTRSGKTVTLGDVAVTPQSRALAVRWPRGGCVWNRPVAILVERDGRKRRVPIVDVTRVAQLGLYGLSVVFVLVGFWMMIRKRRD